MIAVGRKLARRARRVNAELGPTRRGKDLVGIGLGFHSCVFGTKYLPLGFFFLLVGQDKLHFFLLF